MLDAFDGLRSAVRLLGLFDADVANSDAEFIADLDGFAVGDDVAAHAEFERIVAMCIECQHRSGDELEDIAEGLFFFRQDDRHGCLD